MSTYIPDLLVILVLALFAYFGYKKGLVLSLCGLLAFFLAMGGAIFISDQFGDTVSGIIQPYVQIQVEQVLDESLTEDAPDTETLPPTYVPDVPGYSQPEEDPTTAFSLDEILMLLEESEVFTGLQNALEDAIADGTLQVVTTASAAIAAYLAGEIARLFLFFLSFFLILLVWRLLSHILDLACKLPVLRTLNGAGGLIIGLLKGILFLLVLVWLLSLLDVFTAEQARNTYLYRYFLNFQLP